MLTPPFTNYINLLKNWRFISLWGGSLISGIGDAVISLTLIWTVYQQIGSPLSVSLTLICMQLPKFTMAPLLAVFLDRFPIVVFTVVSNIICGFLFLFLSIVPLDTTFNFILFLFLIALSSSFEPMTSTASNIIITEVADRSKLIAANSLMNIQFDIALSLGPIVGGFLVVLGHKEIAFVFNAATFFLAAILFYLAMPLNAYTQSKEVQEGKSVSKRQIRTT